MPNMITCQTSLKLGLMLSRIRPPQVKIASAKYDNMSDKFKIGPYAVKNKVTTGENCLCQI